MVKMVVTIGYQWFVWQCGYSSIFVLIMKSCIKHFKLYNYNTKCTTFSLFNLILLLKFLHFGSWYILNVLMNISSRGILKNCGIDCLMSVQFLIISISVPKHTTAKFVDFSFFGGRGLFRLWEYKQKFTDDK